MPCFLRPINKYRSRRPRQRNRRAIGADLPEIHYRPEDLPLPSDARPRPRRHSRTPRLHAPAPQSPSRDCRRAHDRLGLSRRTRLPAARSGAHRHRLARKSSTSPRRTGLPAVFTPEDCPSGTDRVHAVAQSIPADIYVNIQGDEPLLTPEHFMPLLELLRAARGPGRHPRRALPGRPDPQSQRRQSRHRQTMIALSTSPAPPFPSIATARLRRLSQASRHLRVSQSGASTASPRFRPPGWSRSSAWSSSGFSRTASISMSPPPPSDTIGVDTEEDLRAAEAILSGEPNRLGNRRLGLQVAVQISRLATRARTPPPAPDSTRQSPPSPPARPRIRRSARQPLPESPRSAK